MATKFNVGELYSIEEVQRSLEVGNAGGVRVALGKTGSVRRMVLLTSTPESRNEKENPYHDRVEGGVLVYAGTGLQGDQALAGINGRIITQRDSPFPIYGFRRIGSRRKTEVNRWEFLGLLQFLRYYPSAQIDRNGHLRKMWFFELRVCAEAREVAVTTELAMTLAAFAEFQFDPERESPAEPTAAQSASPDVELIEQVRGKLLALAPTQFEQMIKSALEKAGFVRVSVTKSTGDGGVDVNAALPEPFWPLAGLQLQVQAKRWLHTVGRREVAELRGSLEPFARGALVTTSYFSKAALTEANAAGRSPIVLVDGYRFASVVKLYGLI